MPLQGAIWHVATDGDDEADGCSQKSAFGTIQHAVDAASPGDTILVSEGLYHGGVVFRQGGTAENPIFLKALAGGRNETVLSGADPVLRDKDRRWELADPELGLYRIPLNHRPVRVLAGGVDLPAYPDLADLRAFRFLADDYPGHEHGFAWDSKEAMLYVRLHAGGKYGSTDPNKTIMAVGPPTGGGKWGSEPNRADNFLVSFSFAGPAHAVIEGFTFETPGIGGINAGGGELVVRNCSFFGCRYGVVGREDGSTPNVTVENCFYTQYPVFSDIEETIFRHAESLRKKGGPLPRTLHWQRKGGFPPISGGVGSAYGYETGIVRRMGENWIIRGNHIWEVFEAFSSGSVARSKRGRILDNRIERICDNAFETEEHASGLEIAGNIVVDVFEAFSWQPMSGAPFPGPIYIHDNLVWQTPETARLFEMAGNTGGLFKIGCKDDRNWEKGLMGSLPRDFTEAPGGFWVVQNTLIVPHGKLLTALNPPGRSYKGFIFLNNIISTRFFTRLKDDRKLEGILFAHNAVYFSENEAFGKIAAGPGGLVAPDAAALGLGPSLVPSPDGVTASLGNTSRILQLPNANALEIPVVLPLRKTVGACPFEVSAGSESGFSK